MSRYIDITGTRYGRLVAKRFGGCPNGRQSKWHCLCDCGNECVVRRDSLLCGETASCGCLRSEWQLRNLSQRNKYQNLKRRKTLNLNPELYDYSPENYQRMIKVEQTDGFRRWK